MADEMIFGVGFDVESGTDQAIKDWRVAQKVLQRELDKNTLDVKIKVSDKDSVNQIEKIRDRMKELSEEYDKLSINERFKFNADTGEIDGMTAKAEKLVSEFNKLTIYAETYGRSLQKVSSDAVKELNLQTREIEKQAKELEKQQLAQQKLADKQRLANEKQVAKELALQASEIEKQRAAQAKLMQSQRQKVAILQGEERTINQINAKLKIQSERLRNIDLNSNSFTRVNQEVQRLTTLLAQAEAKVKSVNARGMTQLRSSVANVNKEYSRQLTYVERLVERAGVYGAIFAAGNFIKNIRQVTAEFELQRVSLTAMMQSAADADKLFEQTVAAAVESPFQIKDLIQYTKQLAAFGVENENLFGTTQMLADITAGLGTDFGRIALAYGQIRSRGFLAGTELKQLTELGLAFPEMLAERLSAVEGSAVTVADVFDRISNREITFGQVENIFKELTEDGGRFYEMQEKQAKTLAGLWSNLQDVMSLMYADIGEEIYDEMRGSIELLKSLVENWRTVADVVTAAGVAYGLMWLNSRKLTTATNKFNAILGEEVTGRYASVKAMEAQLTAQARIDNAVANSLKGTQTRMSVAKLSEKQLARQAIVLGNLSQEEAARAIILGQTTKAERAAMIQTGLLTKEQIRAALASRSLAAGGTLVQRAWFGAGVALRNAWNGLSTFFKGNWITIAIAAIGALWAEWSGKSKALEEEMTRVVDAHKGLLQELDKIDAKYKGDIAGGVDALIGKYKELGLEGLSALANLNPDDSLIDQYEQLREGLEGAAVNIKIIKQELAKGFGDWELGGLLGDNIETDIKDVNKSLSGLFVVADIEKTLAPLQREYSKVVDDLTDAEKQRYANLLDGQRAYESEIEYQERLAKAYIDLQATQSKTGAGGFWAAVFSSKERASFNEAIKSVGIFSNAFNKLTSTQQKNLNQLSAAYKEAMGDVDEFAYEIGKRTEDIASSLDIQKMISEGDVAGLQDIAIQIKAVFDDPSYAFNEFTKEIGAQKFGELLGIPLHFFAEFDLPELGELNAIQQALVGSGLFQESEVEFIRDRVSAQKALVEIVEKEANLKKIITEADEDSYNKLMAQNAEKAKANLKEYNLRLKMSQEEQRGLLFNSEEYKEAGLAIQQLEAGIAKYNKELEDSKIPFAEYIANNAKAGEKMSENTRLAYEVAKAIGVLLNITTTKGGSGGEDPFITLMKNRASVMKDFQGGVEDLNKYLSQSGALSQEQDIMRSRAASVGIDVEGLSGTTKELSQWYADAIEQVQAKMAFVGGKQFEELTVEAILSKDIRKKTLKAYQDLLQFIFNAKTDFDTKTLETTLKDNLTRISDEIKRSKEAQNFMQNILSATGNEQLATEMTVSIYGDVGDGLAKQMKAQIVEAFSGGTKMSDALSQGVDKAIKGTKIDYKALQKLIPLVSGEENQKQAQAIVDAGLAANAKYAEGLIKSLNTFQDYETRRTAIAKKGEEEREAIRGLGLSKELEEQQLSASKRKQTEETAKVDVEEFESSEDYIRIFMDLDKISTQTIDSMRGKLKEYIEQLQATGASAEVLKPLIESFEKLSDESLERKPLQALRQGVKDYAEASKEYQRTKQTIDEAEADLAKAEADKQTAEQNFDGSIESGKAYALAIKKAEEATEKLSQAQRDNGKAADDMRKSLKDTNNALNEVGEIGSAALSGVTSLLGTMGIELDGALGSFVGGFDKALGALASIDLTKPASVITGAFGVLEGVWDQTFGAGQAQRVKRANEEIERQAQLISNLEYSYGRLQKAAEDALGVDYIKNYNDQAENLLAQAEAAEAQAAAERSKGKDEDEDATQGYLDTARDTMAEYNDLLDEYASTIVGSGLGDLTKEISSIWLEAKIAGESTMDALKEKSKEMVRSMVSDFVMAAAIERYLEPVFDLIEKTMDNAALIEDPNYWARVATELNEAMENSDVVLSALYDALAKAGLDLTDSTSGLSGISKDIASASEESILGLAAGINTQNYYIGGIKQDTAMIVAILRGGSAGLTPLPSVDVTALITMQNGYLQHLPAIATHTANTVLECQNIVKSVDKVVTRLDRVIKSKGSPTNFVVKTEL